MKIKTNDLTGRPLDWAVDRCLPDAALCAEGPHPYSTDWALAGPIIEREGIGHFCNRTADIGGRFTPDAGADWRAFALNKHGTHYYGPTPLIAAMRCFVASRLGDEVEVPDELMEN